MNHNRYTRDVGVWLGSITTSRKSEHETVLELVEVVRAAASCLARERVLVPTQLELTRWFDVASQAAVSHPPVVEVITDDLPATFDRVVERVGPVLIPRTIILRGTTVVLQPDEGESELDGLVELSAELGGKQIAIRTRSDAWLPFTLYGMRQTAIYERNAPRLERALTCLDQELQLGLDGESTKLAIVQGYRITNLTFDDGDVFVPELAIEDQVGEACTLMLEDGRVVLGRRLRAGSGDEVRYGYVAASPESRVLVTLTGRHDESFEPLRERLTLEVEGIAPLRWIGEPPAAGIPYDDALVESLPVGRAAIELVPLPEAAVIRIGTSIAETLARAHAMRFVVGGVCPELVYVDSALRFTGLVPRSRLFVASAPQRMTGPRSYTVPYEGYETLALGKPNEPKTDVFALCATLQFLATGRHPFGDVDVLPEIISRVIANAPDRYPGSDAFGRVLARGLAPSPSERPTAAELGDALARLP